MSHVLVASPIRQQPEVLDLALNSWRAAADAFSGRVTFLLVDDNTDVDTSDVIDRFAASREGVSVRRGAAEQSTYARHDRTHVWNSDSISRVASMKDAVMAEALRDDTVDYLFLVDSDLVIGPRVLDTLTGHDVDIVAEVFWTEFHRGSPLLPNSWDIHPSRFDSATSVTRLRDPGVYRVGGTGACTMFSRRALQAGVRFEAVPALDLWGEDRHLAVRAACLGFTMWLDTSAPAFHVYRQEDLAPARAWFESGCPTSRWTGLLDDQWVRRIDQWVLAQRGAASPSTPFQAMRSVAHRLASALPTHARGRQGEA